MKKYLVEFIGTFFLVLTVGMTMIDPGAGPLAPLAVGSVLMVMVYAGAQYSGAHYNPAVTIALWVRGRCPTAEVGPYLIAQFFAGGAAGLTALAFKGDPALRPIDLNLLPALLAEFMGAFALCYVFLQVSTTKATAGNPYYGLAIGFAMAAMMMAFAGVSGGAVNPALAIGLAVVHLAKAGSLWIYLVAEFAAGISAALVFRFIDPEDA